MLAVYVVRMVLFFPLSDPMTYDSHSVLGRAISFVEFIIKSFK